MVLGTIAVLMGATRAAASALAGDGRGRRAAVRWVVAGALAALATM